MYRANLLSKNIAKQIELDSIEITSGFHHSLVELTNDLIVIETLDGKKYNYPIKFSEKDFFTTTHLGKFHNGNEFRLIQPTGIAAERANSALNSKGGFTLGSRDPSGWAISFYLTDKDDMRNTNVNASGSREQIEKLVQGSMMSLRFDMPEKFIEFSKRLLEMIEDNPTELSEIEDIEDLEEFIDIMKTNLDVYTSEEQSTISKI
jgi:hypothetical protein